MNRYSSIKSKTTPTGKTVLEMKIFPTLTKQDDDVYIITQETDRLDTIASEFYGDSSLWWVIAHVNNLNSADIGVTPGIQLRIPNDLSKLQSMLNN